MNDRAKSGFNFSSEVYVKKHSLISIICLVGAGACAVACGSSDDTTTTPSAGAGGKSGAGGKGGAGGASAAGKGGTGGGTSTAGSAGSNVDAGSGGEGGAVVATTLYERLGMHAGIAAALDAIVADEVQDPIIATYFSQQASAAHKPTVADIKECFTNLLGKAAGGPELYPFKTTSGYTCRNMATAHATLGIGAGTFDKFVGIAAATLLDLGVAPADVATVGAVLNGTKTDIVNVNIPSGVAPCKSPASCSVPVEQGGAGGESGAGAMAGAGGDTGLGGAAGATL